jgi:hypothetical protein
VGGAAWWRVVVAPARLAGRQPSDRLAPARRAGPRPSDRLAPARRAGPRPSHRLAPARRAGPQPSHRLAPARHAGPQPSHRLAPARHAGPQPSHRLAPARHAGTSRQPGFVISVGPVIGLGHRACGRSRPGRWSGFERRARGRGGVRGSGFGIDWVRSGGPCGGGVEESVRRDACAYPPAVLGADSRVVPGGGRARGRGRRSAVS